MLILLNLHGKVKRRRFSAGGNFWTRFQRWGIKPSLLDILPYSSFEGVAWVVGSDAGDTHPRSPANGPRLYQLR